MACASFGLMAAVPPALSACTLHACRYELGRQAANTKLSSHVAVRSVRVRGGNRKFRALRLDHGNFAWGSEVGALSIQQPLALLQAPCCSLLTPSCAMQAITRKTRILDVNYNASNNELVSSRRRGRRIGCQ